MSLLNLFNKLVAVLKHFENFKIYQGQSDKDSYIFFCLLWKEISQRKWMIGTLQRPITTIVPHEVWISTSLTRGRDRSERSNSRWEQRQLQWTRGGRVCRPQTRCCECPSANRCCNSENIAYLHVWKKTSSTYVAVYCNAYTWSANGMGWLKETVNSWNCF